MRTRLIAIAFMLSVSLTPFVGVHAQEASGPVSVDSGDLETILEAYLLQRGVDIVVGNIKASQHESGDIDKAVRATLGISIADIKSHGLLGGPNSEMRKLFNALGIN